MLHHVHPSICGQRVCPLISVALIFNPRPGQHIDLDVNPNQLPPVGTSVSGINRPGFAFDTTDYWIQGINLGGEYRW